MFITYYFIFLFAFCVALYTAAPLNLRARVPVDPTNFRKYDNSSRALTSLISKTYETIPNPFFNHETMLPLYLHVSKTGGTSFKEELLKYGYTADWKKYGVKNYSEYTMKFNLKLFSIKTNGTKIPFTFTLIRSPRSHVHSMFLECKHDSWGKRTTNNTLFPRKGSDKDDFTEWIDHFYNNWNKIDDETLRNITLDNFNCYHPYNFQTRALSDDCGSSIHKFNARVWKL